MSKPEPNTSSSSVTATSILSTYFIKHGGALWPSFDVYTDNMQDLQSLLVAAQENEQLQIELFQNVRAPVVRDAYVRALDKTLHNALAAAVSLVDHTRRHVAEYFPDSQFAREFESKNAEVANLSESMFLRRFRNYLLHVGHAPFKMTGTFSNKNDGGGTATVWLVSEELLKSSLWTGPARKFIEDHPGGIDLLKVLDAYKQIMVELYRWAFDQQSALSPDGLDILNEFTRRLNLTLTKGSHDGRSREQFIEHVTNNLHAAREGRPQADWRDVKSRD